MEENEINFRKPNAYNRDRGKNQLLDRIFDKGLGGKFSEFSSQPSKKKELKAFLTNFEEVEGLHNDPNYITNMRIGDLGKNTGQNSGAKIENSNKKLNKAVDPQMNAEKINLLSKKFDTKNKEPILDTWEREDEEKEDKNLQELESITGFKTMNQLPPSRGTRYNSVNPMERNRVATHRKEERTGSILGFNRTDKYSQPLDPKLSRPTTTIVSLTKRDTQYINEVTTKPQTHELERNIEHEEKMTEMEYKSNQQVVTHSDNKKTETFGDNDEDQYMDKINKFIKEAFEGKDYKINFVYYLPSGKDNFYEPIPTTFEHINKERVYYTLSAKGLTVYIDKKPREFIKLSEWIIEKQGYNYVSGINFFKNFKIWRILKNWRKNIFKQKKIAYQNELANTLLFNNKDYNDKICEHKSQCNRILKTLKILDLKVSLESNNFDAFKKKQADARERIKKGLIDVQDKCDKIFINGIKRIFNEVQRKINAQNNEANYNEDDVMGKKKKRFNNAIKKQSDNQVNQRDNDKNDEAILNDDNIVGFENYPYKFKMMIKNECLNFIKLAYLFDYIMLDVLRRTYIFSMQETLKKLEDFNMIETPSQVKENILNKREEYVKPTVTNPNRVIPYFLVKCKLDEKPIENRDRIRVKVKEFFVKATPDDEFDPTAHIQKDPEEEELLAIMNANDKKGGPTNNSEVQIRNMNMESQIEVEVIERPHYYFNKYDPNPESLTQTFIKQIDDALTELKVKGWKAHPVFKKYLPYLENWDDRFGDWDNDTPLDLDPQEILTLSEDPLYQDKNEMVETAIKIAYKKCDQFMQKLDPFLQLHWKQKSINQDLLLLESLKDSDEMYRLIFYFTEKNIRTLQRWIPFEEEIGMIKLTLEEGLRKDLILEQSATVNFLKPLLPNILRERSNRIEKWISEMYRQIQGSIDSEKQYLDKTKAKDTLDQWFYIYERKLNTIDTIINLLKNKSFEISSEDLKNVDNINSLKFQLKLAWDELNDSLTKNREKLRNMVLTISIPHLLKETERIDSLISDEKFLNYDRETQGSLIPSYITELETYENMYKHIDKNKDTYNDFLVILGEPDYNFDRVQMVHDNLKLLKNLWNALKDFDEECDEWKKTRFSEINTQEILRKIDEYYTHGKKAELQFGDVGSAIKELLTNVNNFKESMQVIDDLNSSFLKSHHWERIQNLFPENTQKLKDKDYPLEYLLEIRAYEHQKIIHDIALEAMNFDILKGKIKEITDIKRDIVFKVENYKDNYKRIDELDKVVEKIEECQSKLNNVLASRYVRLLKADRDSENTATVKDDPFIMKADFDGCLEMIEDMKTFQKKWMYLENIINNGEMKRNIPDNQFDKVDSEWKSLITKIADGQTANVMTFYLKNKKQDFFQRNLEKLEETQQKIEEMLKGLRIAFERFFFISNDDLLYMLSKSTISSSSSNANPINDIKPYLCKIFEDIGDLIIPPAQNAAGKDIAAIVSTSKEELYFEKNFERKTVKITDKLDDWLRGIENQMLSTLKEKMSYGYSSYADITKDAIGHEMWLEKITVSKDKEGGNAKENVNTTPNISQVISTITHVMFCENTENVIQIASSDPLAFEQWYNKINSSIGLYAKMVNKDFSTSNKNMRRIISNLITHHVHYKAIIATLIGDEPSDPSDFVWQQQLRAYILPLDPNAVNIRDLEKNMIVRIKQLKSDMEYGYEYIGPTPRVVITPLTDRVWLTMTSALNIKLGCSLGGPAGTGKTETTKDLAKFFGIQCIVFNCSEQIDYKILGNIFSGLCKHGQGVYACLDEFNRINVEVLSVVATQLFNIRQALLSGSPTVYVLSEIDLVGKLGVFITMNPTYSGRTELPDNLKSSFRPITMMVPDFLTIAEVKLYSEGFSESKALAKKLTKLYSLASQQLSQQDHYDFTLRTVGSVLSIAGNLKRSFKSAGGDKEKKEEELILLNALRDANFPKFVHDDVQLFKALLSDLFPETELTEPSLEEFENEVKNVIEEEKLHESNFIIKKSLQVFEIVNIRLGICLTGPAGTGKTTCINLVEKAMTNLRKKYDKGGDPRFKEVQKKTINPKSITMGELYGQENEDTKTFIFGIATRKIKKALLVKPEEADLCYRWVVLDGPIDTKWIENMNSVLDDSMTLCLSNGERIKLKPHVKVFFEVEDLSQASLATVSRLGIAYLGATELGWRPYFYAWLKRKFPDESILSAEMKNFLTQLFEGKMDDTIENLDDLEQNGSIFIKPVISQCVASLCNFLEIYFTQENGFIGKETPNLDNLDVISRIKKKIIYIYAFCLIWGVFGCVNNKGFHKIESFVRNKFLEIKMDNSQLIMEHYYDLQKNDYVKYSTENVPFNYIKGMPYFSIFVPTIDTLRYSTIFESLVKNQKHIFITGETGVGKTAILLNILRSLLATEEWTSIQMNLSAQTSSEDLQKSLESKLEPKRGKKIMAGKGGKKLTIFIDDINMPEPNDWGAHPPIELLRQYLDQGGFYDRPKFYWKRIEDASMIVSGGPPIGGRSKLTDRFGRHFNLLCVPQTQ